MGAIRLPATRGYELRDPLGQKIGRVEELFAGGDGRPKHGWARLGPFGLGRSVLIPVAAVVVDGERRVVVLRYAEPSLP